MSANTLLVILFHLFWWVCVSIRVLDLIQPVPTLDRGDERWWYTVVSVLPLVLIPLFGDWELLILAATVVVCWLLQFLLATWLLYRNGPDFEVIEKAANGVRRELWHYVAFLFVFPTWLMRLWLEEKLR